MNAEIVIVGGVRTPFGRFGGALKDMSSLQLAVLVVAEAVKRAGVSPADVDGVVFGTVLQDTPQGVYMAKHAGLQTGMSERITGLCVNRACGSGIQAVVTAAQSIAFGDGLIYVAGGAECLSHMPFLVPGARYGLRLGDAALVDPLSGESAAFRDPFSNMVMGATGDRIAGIYGISREEADEFALRSHQRALAANRNGSFARDFVTIPDVIEADEHPRETSLDKLATLPTIFTDGGVCTAGNSSGLNDGAGALLVLSAGRAEELGVARRARLVSYAVTGCAPDVMGMGPVSSSRRALERAGLTLSDLDVIEINEAFAAQVLAVGKELEWNWERVNPNGGAVALGHPLGASGVRLMVMLLRELEDSGGRYGMATACIGGGQGISVIVERLG